MLIEIEGIDFAGKTTQCGLLLEFLRRSRGINAIILKELTSTELGAKLRELLVSRVPRDAKAEVFSFLAAKAQLYAQVVVPALAEGKYVIADRGSLSFLSYHHISAGMDIATLREMMDIATGSVRPNITIVLDVPVEVTAARMNHRNDLSVFDKKGEGFFAAQRRVFRNLCGSLPRCVLIDGSLSIKEVHARVRPIIEGL
ncbi:MAG: dTMP kinase [Candidatus Liptonbacteria bacterium]|nr:dTMP kinase [Candidatus Liptonbacteria bacterium]